MVFTLVDLETTGGSPRYDRIVEIAMLRIENGEITNRYHSLINPECPIPMSVSLIHGIRNEDVENEPSFSDLGEEILSFLGETIFMAHAVQFDYGFLKAEFDRMGLRFELKKICTARLSRKLLPHLKSHSLSNLCKYYSIENKRAHRAMEDAEATAWVLKNLSALPEYDSVLLFFLKKGTREMRLLPQIDEEKLASLPPKTGIYRFYDEKGKIIYVGKAINLKERVKQHLFGQTHTHDKNRFIQSVFSFDFEETGNELFALLLENELIKKHYPRYNSTNKAFNLNVGLFSYEDQQGYLRLCLGEAGKWTEPLAVFSNRSQALSDLLRLSMENGLCLKLNGLLERGISACDYETESGKRCAKCSDQLDSISYNDLVFKLIESNYSGKTFLLKSAGRSENESAFVWVEKGKLKGYGYLPTTKTPLNLPDVKPFLKPYYDTTDSQGILNHFLPRANQVGLLDLQFPILEIL